MYKPLIIFGYVCKVNKKQKFVFSWKSNILLILSISWRCSEYDWKQVISNR